MAKLLKVQRIMSYQFIDESCHRKDYVGMMKTRTN